MTTTNMTVGELTIKLIEQGLSPIEAATRAEARFAQVQAPVETPQATEAEVKETKVAGRPWFKRATDKLFVSDKDLLIGHLLVERAQAKDAQEKEEIQGLIDKLRNKEGFYKEKVEPAIASSKGWAVDATGKLADGLYLTGNYVNKGATGITEFIGKTTQAVGKGIVIAGEAIEEAAPAVGKIVEAPFKFTGDTLNIVNGTKEIPKPTTK